MRIDHGCADVLMSEEFLDGTDIVSLFEEVGSERVAEGMAAAVLGDAGLADGIRDGTLEGAIIGMMSVFSLGRVDLTAFA